jgi:hypothetical protein
MDKKNKSLKQNYPHVVCYIYCNMWIVICEFKNKYAEMCNDIVDKTLFYIDYIICIGR